MFVFITLFGWLYDLFTFEDKAKENMNLLKSVGSNFSKMSYVISHISGSKKNHLKLWSQIKSLMLKDKPELDVFLPVLKLNRYEIFNAGRKLVLEKNALLDQNFQFRPINNIGNLKLLLITSEHFSSQNSKICSTSVPFKLEDYFDIVATQSDICILAGYNEEEQFLSFCDELIQRDFCNVFTNKFISTITNFDMEDNTSAIIQNITRKDKVSMSSSDVCVLSILEKLQHQMDLNTFEKTINKVNDLGLNNSEAENDLVHSGKPPNVLVYTGSDGGDKKYQDVRSILNQCLARDKYVIYHLRKSQVMNAPWIDNTILLVIASNNIPRNELCESFLTYFLKGGTLISLSSNFDDNFLNLSRPYNHKSQIIKISYEDLSDVSVYGSMNCYDMQSCTEKGISFEEIATSTENGDPVIVLAKHATSAGKALLSLVSFERDSSEESLTIDQFVSLKLSNPSRISVFRSILTTIGINCSQMAVPPLSILVLCGSSKETIGLFLSAIKDNLKNNLYVGKRASYDLVSNKQLGISNKIPSETYLPVTIDGVSNGIQNEFNFDAFKKNLNSKVLGNIAFFGSVVTTTMNIIDDFMDEMPSSVGLVAIASCQTKGIGRGGNVWLSPKGCALFSLHIRLSLDSPLGHYISCFQQLAALASVLAIKKKKGYEKINLRIKWPNDIYYGDKLKLGGVLVKSSILGNIAHINLGCGVNISNENPTTCLNDLIRQHNNSCPNPDDLLKLFTVEEFVGRAITQIEHLIDEFQEDFGDSFYELYHEHWLHSNQEVNLYEANGPKGKIMGITQEGYLLVRLDDGHNVEVHPDGNSFDMMKNLIISKFQR